MWLQTALEATATVRILGPHTMVSRDVKYQLGEEVVAGHPKVAGWVYSVDPGRSQPHINHELLIFADGVKTRTASRLWP